MSDGRPEVETLRGDERLPKGHFEYPFIEGSREYPEYASYVADHHICEIMMGRHNWRAFGMRAERVNEPIDQNVFLLYEDDLSLGVRHNFQSLRGGGGGGPIASAVGSIAQGVGQIASAAHGGLAGAAGEGIAGSDLMLAPLRLLDAHYYKGSDAWAFNVKFTFRHGQNGLWDAKREVFDPLIALLVMCTAVDAGGEDGDVMGWPVFEAPGPSQYGLIGSVASELLTGGGGEDEADEDDRGFIEKFKEALRGVGGAEVSRTISDSAKAVTLIFGLNFKESLDSFGRELGDDADDMNFRNVFYFDPCYIEGITVSFSNQKDLSGYPIQGTVDLDIRTMLPALGNDISKLNADWEDRLGTEGA